MLTDLQELRFDIPLPKEVGPRAFERGWRAVLAAQRLTALAMPPAEAITARFRFCGSSVEALSGYLTARLSALPGSPQVSHEPTQSATDWQGVKIWLSYRALDLTALLKNSKVSSHSRGRRP